jgi:hypothetical protein
VVLQAVTNVSKGHIAYVFRMNSETASQQSRRRATLQLTSLSPLPIPLSPCASTCGLQTSVPRATVVIYRYRNVQTSLRLLELSLSVARPEAEDFSSNLCVQTGSGAHRASRTMGTAGSLPGGKARSRRDADHSPPSKAEVKKV